MAAPDDGPVTTRGRLRAVHLPDSRAALEEAGFAPGAIGGVQLLPESSVGLAAEIEGLTSLDGLVLHPPTSPEESMSDSPAHPNGVRSIDHVVVMTPNPDRTTSAFEANGIEARRVRRFDTKRGAQRQTFHWLGDTICEVAGPDDGTGDDPASWWGLALTVDDIDATAATLGELASPVKDAVQRGRRVCTLRSPRITTPILFISPHVRSESPGA